jgi:outer membrane immunogenic protein
MRKQFLIGTAVAAISVALSGPLAAAPQSTPGVFNWSGFYIGGDIGAGSAKFGADISQPGEDKRAKGLLGGVLAGFNFQNGNIVWGLEADISAGQRRVNISDNVYINDLLASVRGRLGLAFDRVLVYATGGWGYAHGKTFSSSALGQPFSFKVYKPVVGGGIDYAATNNLIFRFEVLDFLGKKDIGGLNGTDDGNKLKDIWVTRIAVIYKFGMP